jgi:hypothetical protein
MAKSKRKVQEKSFYNVAKQDRHREFGEAFAAKAIHTPTSDDMILNDFFACKGAVAHLQNSGRDSEAVRRRVWALATGSNGRRGRIPEYQPGPLRNSRIGQSVNEADLLALRKAFSGEGVDNGMTTPAKLAKLLGRNEEEVIQILRKCTGSITRVSILDTEDKRDVFDPVKVLHGIKRLLKTI